MLKDQNYFFKQTVKTGLRISQAFEKGSLLTYGPKFSKISNLIKFVKLINVVDSVKFLSSALIHLTK